LYCPYSVLPACSSCYLRRTSACSTPYRAAPCLCAARRSQNNNHAASDDDYGLLLNAESHFSPPRPTAPSGRPGPYFYFIFLALLSLRLAGSRSTHPPLHFQLPHGSVSASLVLASNGTGGRAVDLLSPSVSLLRGGTSQPA
jgi:hypothetical protein